MGGTFVEITKDMPNEKVIELLDLANQETPELTEDEQLNLLLVTTMMRKQPTFRDLTMALLGLYSTAMAKPELLPGVNMILNSLQAVNSWMREQQQKEVKP